MKQRLEASDYKKATPEQKEWIRDWWKPRWGDFFIWLAPLREPVTDLVLSGEFIKDYDTVPLLSIGQMIELLDEHDKKGKRISLDHYSDGWWFRDEVYDDEPADVLWIACLEVIPGGAA